MDLIITKAQYSFFKITQEQLVKASWSSIPFFFLSKTDREISVLAEASVFSDCLACESGWRAFYVSGVIPFEACGVLSSLLKPLAEQKVSILAMSTFDTDWVFFKEPHLSIVESSLSKAGFTISYELRQT